MKPRTLTILIYLLIYILILAGFYIFDDSPIRSMIEVSVGVVLGLLMPYLLNRLRS